MKLAKQIVLACTVLMATAVAGTQGSLHIETPCACNNRPVIAVAGFAHEDQLPQKISSVVKRDLLRSGSFRVIDADSSGDSNTVDYTAYAKQGADALVVGTVERLADNRVRVSYRLVDINRQAELSAQEMILTTPSSSLPAHLIADDTHFKLSGITGVSASRIAFVRHQNNSYQLMVAEADGENASVVHSVAEPLMAPAWSPDGTRLAYITYQQNRPVVMVHQLITGARTLLASDAHPLSAPAWSADGRQLALTLAPEGRPQIYTVDADGGPLRRISSGASNDSEPQWSADGLSIYFTSDRSGRLQIYRMAADGSHSQRITFSGSPSSSPRIAPNGKMLVYLSHAEGNLQLVTLDLYTYQQQHLAQAADAQSPGFAPNGLAILYTEGSGSSRTLTVISIDGRFKQALPVPAGDTSWPAWGPTLPQTTLQLQCKNCPHL